MRPLLLVVIVWACGLVGCGMRTQERASGQPTMTELAKRQAAERQKSETERQRLVNLSPPEVAGLERQLSAKPDDFTLHEQLWTYYNARHDIANRNRHVLWALEHAPEARISPTWMLRRTAAHMSWAAGFCCDG